MDQVCACSHEQYSVRVLLPSMTGYTIIKSLSTMGFGRLVRVNLTGLHRTSTYACVVVRSALILFFACQLPGVVLCLAMAILI